MSTEVTAGTATRSLKRSQVRLITVFFMIYILVSGGSFGIEDMVSSSGPGLTILLLILLPVFWSLPMALVASELGSALPGEGGFYVWARRGLGDFWGFQTAWWWSLSIFVDSSVYIVLGVGYLKNWLHFDQIWFYVICWAIIALFTVVNIYGVQLVALGSTLFSVLILAPFFVLIVVGLAKWQFNPLTPFFATGVPKFGSNGVFGVGLAIGVWMYSGYESMSTLSGEIRNPQKHHPARPHARGALHHHHVRAADGREPRRLRALGHLRDRGRRRLQVVRGDRPSRSAARSSASRCWRRRCSATSRSTSTTSPRARARSSRSRPTGCSPRPSRG